MADGSSNDSSDNGSRRLLGRLKQLLAEPAEGQERLDRITQLIAAEMALPVCSIYLFRDADTLEQIFARGRSLRRAIVEAGQEKDVANFGRNED